MYRCYHPKAEHFEDYGGRGIRVHPRWHIFENFLADMGLKPSRQHQLDRYPNNDGNYEPDNCRWALARDNHRNRRKSSHKFVELNGNRKLLVEWAEETGISRWTLASRLRAGWSPERTLTTPSNTALGRRTARKTKATKHIRFRGKTKNLSQWSLAMGLSAKVIANRLRAGWSIRHALTLPSCRTGSFADRPRANFEA